MDRLNTLQAPCLAGYASVLARLAAEQRAHRLHIAPTVIISTSETLLPEARAEITTAFGTTVINSFASTEGLMGIEHSRRRRADVQQRHVHHRAG